MIYKKNIANFYEYFRLKARMIRMYDYKDNLGRIKEILNIFPLYTLPYNEAFVKKRNAKGLLRIK